jgi:threonine/homoserine/homoserine lactone efflux protein
MSTKENQTLEVKEDITDLKRWAHFSLFLGAGFIWLFILAIYGTFVTKSNPDWHIWLLFFFILSFGIYLLIEGFLRLRVAKKKSERALSRESTSQRRER